jgi:hypothetical protein
MSIISTLGRLRQEDLSLPYTVRLYIKTKQKRY